MTIGMDSGVERSSGKENPLQTRLARRLLDELQYRADLVLFAGAAPSRWTDALLTETRFHVAATMNAMEMAIKLEIFDRDAEMRLNGLGQPYCSVALEGQVDLLSPALLSHYRLRGALSVILRERRDAANDGADDLIGWAGDGPFARSLAALILAEQRWCGPRLLDAPLRPDLPAEHFSELAWTSAALMIRGAALTTDEADRAVVRAVVHAVERVMARHDEGTGPFALAQRCARALSVDERMRLAPAALIERRLLLFCALVEAETTLPIDAVIGALVDGGDEARQAILKLMRIDEAFAVHVYEMLAPLMGRGGDGDDGLALFVEGYRAFAPAKADAWLARKLVPQALAAKLSVIEAAA